MWSLMYFRITTSALRVSTACFQWTLMALFILFITLISCCSRRVLFFSLLITHLTFAKCIKATSKRRQLTVFNGPSFFCHFDRIIQYTFIIATVWFLFSWIVIFKVDNIYLWFVYVSHKFWISKFLIFNENTHIIH